MSGGDGLFIMGSGASGDGFAAGIDLTSGSDDQGASLAASDGKLLVPGGGPRLSVATANVFQTNTLVSSAAVARYRKMGNHEVILLAQFVMTAVGVSGVAITPTIAIKFGDVVLSSTPIGPIGTFQYWKSAATAQWFFGTVYAPSVNGLSNLQLIAQGATTVGGQLGTAPAFAAAIGDHLDLQLRYEASSGVT